VTGLDERAALTEYTGHQHGIEVNLSPPGIGKPSSMCAHEVAGRCVALEDVLGATGRELPERLATAPGWEARFALLDRPLAGRLAAARPASPDVVRAWALLERSHGRVGSRRWRTSCAAAAATCRALSRAGGPAAQDGGAHPALRARHRPAARG
jgi:hypothetical protein